MVQRPIAIVSNQRHNLGCYCPRTFEMAKVSKKPGVEPRASGLSCQCSATELQHPPTTTPLACPYDSFEVDAWMNFIRAKKGQERVVVVGLCHSSMAECWV